MKLPWLSLVAISFVIGCSNNSEVSNKISLPKNPIPGDTITGGLGMKFAFVPAGKVWLGGGSGRRGNDSIEISSPLYVGIFEVTQGEWKEVMGSNPSGFSRNGESQDKVSDIPNDKLARFPVDNVSYRDVQQFLTRLNNREKGKGVEYQLPSSFVWEAICRGGPTSGKMYNIENPFTFNYYCEVPTQSISTKQANFNGRFLNHKDKEEPSLNRPCEVGLYKPNSLGIYDMHGNVWEWTSSGEDFGRLVVVKGGSWGFHGEYCAVSDRERYKPEYRNQQLGFRLIAVPSDK